MGDGANHEQIGQLLLVTGLGPDVAAAVGNHHTVGRSPSDLVCLLHMANNLCRDLGLGYFPEERSIYSKAVLHRLGMEKKVLEPLLNSLGDEAVGEIVELIAQCM